MSCQRSSIGRSQFRLLQTVPSSSAQVAKISYKDKNLVELYWLELLWNDENIFETGVGRASEC